jgi:hypothetical protein
MVQFLVLKGLVSAFGLTLSLQHHHRIDLDEDTLCIKNLKNP